MVVGRSNHHLARYVTTKAIAKMGSWLKMFGPTSRTRKKTTAATVLLLIIAVYGYLKRKRERSILMNAPPGDLGLYYIGQMFNFFISIESFDLKMIKTYGLNHTSHVFFEPIVRVGHPEDRTLISRSEAKGLSEVSWPSHFNKLMGPDAMTVVTGERHAFLRKFFYNSFTPELLRTYVATVDECIRTYLDKMRDDGKTHSTEEFKTLSLQVLMQTAFAGSVTTIEVGHLSRLFMAWVNGLGSILPFNLPFTSFGVACRAREEIIKELKRLIAKHRETLEATESRLTSAKQKNLLLRAMAYKDEQGRGFTEEEICDNLLVLLFAGHETTASVFSTLVCLLYGGSHPNVLNKLKQEARSIDNVGEDGLRGAVYICAVVDETLRAYPPINGFFRRAKQDIPLSDGYIVPKGVAMSAYVTAGHSADAAVWGDVNLDFNPDRMLRVKEQRSDIMRTHYFPFGTGNRICVGEPLARLELRLFLYRIARDYQLDVIGGKRGIGRDSVPVNKLRCKFKVLKNEAF